MSCVGEIIQIYLSENAFVCVIIERDYMSELKANLLYQGQFNNLH